MDSSSKFTRLLREWAEVFIHRSMHDFMEFSRSAGLSMTQLSALMRLYHGGACAVSGLGSHLGVSNAAASQMIERLVQQKLLIRTEDPLDRRVKSVTLSPEGRTLIEAGLKARQRWTQELTGVLSSTEQETVAESLELLIAAARRETPADHPQAACQSSEPVK
jgi:DNA-binding MarR family transcriptional regulator